MKETNLIQKVDIHKIVFVPCSDTRFQTSNQISYPFSLNHLMHSIVRSLALTEDLHDQLNIDPRQVFKNLSSNLRKYENVIFDADFKKKFSVDSIIKLDFAYSDLVND